MHSERFIPNIVEMGLRTDNFIRIQNMDTRGYSRSDWPKELATDLNTLWKLQFQPQGVTLEDFYRNFAPNIPTNKIVYSDNRVTHCLAPEDYLAVLSSRSAGLYSQTEKESMGQSKVAILGMSTGSHLARLMAQSGFIGNVTVVDGDIVELHNLERMALADRDDVGRNKAIVVAQRMLKINPYMNMNVIPHNIDEDGVRALLKENDVLVEMIDDVLLKLQIRLIAQKIADETNTSKSVVAGTDLFSAPLVTVDRAIPNGSISIFQNQAFTKRRAETLLEQRTHLSTVEKSRIAIELIGLQRIPPRHLADFILVINGYKKFWSQRGIDASDVAGGMYRAVCDVVIGNVPELIWYSLHNTDDTKYFVELCRLYPDLYNPSMGSLKKANEQLIKAS